MGFAALFTDQFINILERKRERDQMVVQVQMVFQILLLLMCSIYVAISGQATNSSCQASCGGVSIPYPFGIGPACYLDHWFEVVCNDSSGSPKPFLRSLFNLEVLNISLGGTVRVNYRTLSSCTSDSSIKENVELANSSFIFSKDNNIFVALGCDNFASMESVDGSGSVVIGVCMSVCTEIDQVSNASMCNGINCCETTIPSHLDAFNTRIDTINIKNQPNTEGCQSAFLVDKKWFNAQYYTLFSNLSSIMSYVPVVLEWGILNTSFNSLPTTKNASFAKITYNCIGSSVSGRNTTFTCSCNDGFEGNPYLLEGCQGKVFAALYLSL